MVASLAVVRHALDDDLTVCDRDITQEGDKTIVPGVSCSSFRRIVSHSLFSELSFLLPILATFRFKTCIVSFFLSFVIDPPFQVQLKQQQATPQPHR